MTNTLKKAFSKLQFWVSYSEENKEYTGLCLEYPVLAWTDESEDLALIGIKNLVEQVLSASSSILAESEKHHPTCNLCGLSCNLGEDCGNDGGLIDCTVTGNYDSTPGNGGGALDDLTSYTFSLCEWCLDWLFCNMKIPPVIFGPHDGCENFLPAKERVNKDEWRSQKDKFYQRMTERVAARRQQFEKVGVNFVNPRGIISASSTSEQTKESSAD